MLYSAAYDVVLIFDAATDESQKAGLLRAKLALRNEVMDAISALLEACHGRAISLFTVAVRAMAWS